MFASIYRSDANRFLSFRKHDDAYFGWKTSCLGHEGLRVMSLADGMDGSCAFSMSVTSLVGILRVWREELCVAPVASIVGSSVPIARDRMSVDVHR